MRVREPIAYCATCWEPAARHQPNVPGSTPGSFPAATAGKPHTTPGWRLEQQLQALSKANQIRVAQAQLKKELTSGTTQIRGILTQPPDYAANLQVSKLLRAVPGYGPARVARVLTKTRITESTRLAGLTYRQRTELIDHFRANSSHRPVDSSVDNNQWRPTSP
jgi:hypothetical protein